MRRKILGISAELLEQMLREPRLDAIKQEGFPEDAKIAGCFWTSLGREDTEPERGIVYLVIESESFDEVPHGINPPEMIVGFTVAK
jgi:hypothetical protein